MKKLVATLLLNISATALLAQGTINFANSPTTQIQTNTLGIGGAQGNTAPTLNGFRYEVLTAPSTVTSVDSSLQGLLSAPWSDTGVSGTNTTLATGGRLNGGNFRVANNWAPSVMQSYIVVGWSANLGTTWTQLAAQLTGATFNSGDWCLAKWKFRQHRLFWSLNHSASLLRRCGRDWSIYFVRCGWRRAGHANYHDDPIVYKCSRAFCHVAGGPWCGNFCGVP